MRPYHWQRPGHSELFTGLQESSSSGRQDRPKCAVGRGVRRYINISLGPKQLEESGYLSIMNSEGVLFIILMAIGKGGYLMLLHAICATASYCRAVCRLLLATARYCALLLLLRATARYCEKI